MKSLIIGLVLFLVGWLIAGQQSDERFLLLYSTFVGGGLWLVSALILATLYNGERQSTRRQRETLAKQRWRLLMVRLFIIGLPCVGAAVTLMVQE